jgi:protease I
MALLKGRRILMFAGDGYEDLELHYPRLRLQEEAAEVVVAGVQADTVFHGKHGYPCTSDVAFVHVDTDDFSGLVIPGGRMPDRLRTDERVVAITRAFAEENKVVGAICHGGQILISAGLVAGRRMTCWKSVRDDLVNAGAKYVDEPVVVDAPFVTSRQPDDLPAFGAALIGLLAAGARSREKAPAAG